MSVSSVAGNGVRNGAKGLRGDRIDEIFDLDRALRNHRFESLRALLYDTGFADLP
jgi:hypothetical protein